MEEEVISQEEIIEAIQTISEVTVVEVSTQIIGQTLSMTATRDIIEAVATGPAPEQASLFMGYSGWGAGQIEDEIANNGWLVSDANEDMVLSVDHGGKWQSALGLMGIDALMLSSYGGTA